MKYLFNTYTVIAIFFSVVMLLTIQSCSSDLGISSEAGGGEVLSGSYARMLRLDNRLYVIGRNSLRVLDTTDPSNPTPMQTIDINAEVESLFRNDEFLFVGSQEAMFIYEIDSNGIPVLIGETPYAEFLEFTCFSDPIVANRNTAYVTLSTDEIINNFCFRSLNELRVYDLANVSQPDLLDVIPMQEPKGLGLDGDHLFVCERFNGVSAFNVADPSNVEQFYQSEPFQAVDLIPASGNLLVIGVDTIYQYDYSDISNITRISAFATQD